MSRTVRLICAGCACLAALLAWTTCRESGPEPDGASDEPPPEVGGAPSDASGDAAMPERPAPRTPRPRAARPTDEAAGDPSSEDSDAPAVAEPANAGELPKDALGSGPLAVSVVCVDDASSARVESVVRLWRLGVPASDAWTAGDHVQASGTVTPEGLSFRDLPAGRYRIEAVSARKGSEDPPAFELSEATAAQPVVVRLPMPRRLPVRCVVYDEWGGLAASATLVSGSEGSSWSSFRPAPAWTTPRRARNPSNDTVGVGGGASGRSGGRRMRTVTAAADGFDLGAMSESSRARSWSRRDRLQFDGHNAVGIDVRSDAMGDPAGTTWVGFTVSLARLVSHVSLPDGRPALDGGAKVAGDCAAAATADRSPTGARNLAITVTVTHPECRPLEFEWRLADEPLAPVRMTPFTGTPVETPK